MAMLAKRRGSKVSVEDNEKIFLAVDVTILESK